MNMNTELEASRAEVVATLGEYTFTRGELTDMFNLVADAKNWKNPVDATVDFSCVRDRLAAHVAVEFFTGSRPTMTFIFNESTGNVSKYRVQAAGYYAAIGA